MNTNTAHAQALADKAESLYTKNKHAEAFSTYRAAVAAVRPRVTGAGGGIV
jgi:hypothetical protein